MAPPIDVRGWITAGALVTALAGPAGARAAVRIDAHRIVVSTAGARATVTRSPFRIAFADAAGRRILAEIAGAGSARPYPLAVPVPPSGAAPLRQRVLYAPLTFTLGRERITAFPNGSYVGNLFTSLRTGTQYSARRVLSARAAGGGARLVLTTTAPVRRLVVTIAPDRGAAIHVSARVTPGTGVAAIADTFSSPRGEAFHGFGGRHNALDQRGSAFYSWAEEENVDAKPFAVPGAATGRVLYPNGPTAAYAPQAQFVSSRHYGFLLDRPELARWRLASGRADAWQADVTARRLDYVVAPGSAPRAIGTLTALTGRQRVPPAWGLGPMLDRATAIGETPATYAAKVRADLRNISLHHLPLRAYRIEGWNILPRATLEGFIRELHRRHIRVLVYFRAFVAHDLLGTEPPSVYDYAIRHGLVARTRSGAAYTFTPSTPGSEAVIDFTNPAAVRWWTHRIRAALDLGADGFMQDFGEQVLPGMVFHDGRTGAVMHNAYPVLYHRVTRRILDAYTREHPKRSIFFFTRAGYSGRPGSAAYENANFPGDETTDWTHSSGLKSQIPDMLNRGIGGAFGFGTDIGGYFDLKTPPTTKELFLRWAELAALTPVFRLHGSLIAGTHTPWSYDAATVRTYVALSRLHLRAAPLILRLWRGAARTGLPVTRPLWLADPGYARGARQDQEFLLGPDVLVAPVVDSGARRRSVAFPAGCWRDAATGRRYTGRSSHSVAAPLTRLPYFRRCGTSPLATAAGG